MSDSQPFTGIRVVEFGQFVAVPFCAQLLADGGATVIKIEAPEGDPTRAFNPFGPGETRIFLSRNRGKHSLPLRLSDPAARPVLDALLAWADVILMNFRPGLDKQLGLDPASVLVRFPKLVIASVTAFGKTGPNAALAGMDIVVVVQARSGLMAANGRMIDGRPAPGDPVSADYMSAMSLSFGVASALLRRERTGKGGIVDVSLMHAAMTLANNQLTRSEDRDRPVHEKTLAHLAELRAAGAPHAEQAATLQSSVALGTTKVYFRTYETADRPIAVGCGSRSLRLKFAAIVGIDDPSLHETRIDGPEWEAHYNALSARAEAILRSKTAAQWTALCNDAGIPVSAVKFPIEMFDDPQAHANGMRHDMQHPTAGTVRVVAPPISLDGEGFKTSQPTPPLGSETDAILTQLGLSAEAIEALVTAGVTRRDVSGDG